ncbi:hypothetical protein HPB47_018179, partial [Ixodes persulcatus]
VSLKHVEELVAIDSKHDLKLVPKLKQTHLNPSHFDKMDVRSAHALLNHAVGAAIKLLVLQGKMAEEALTTAWFLELVHKWFSLMTSRSFKLAMSEANPIKHEEAMTFLADVSDIFSRLCIRKEGQRKSFKPCQAGMMITTQSALRLQDILLKERGFNIVFM